MKKTLETNINFKREITPKIPHSERLLDCKFVERCIFFVNTGTILTDMHATGNPKFINKLPSSYLASFLCSMLSL